LNRTQEIGIIFLNIFSRICQVASIDYYNVHHDWPVSEPYVTRCEIVYKVSVLTEDFVKVESGEGASTRQVEQSYMKIVADSVSVYELEQFEK
jgi:hypothetical protein